MVHALDELLFEFELRVDNVIDDYTSRRETTHLEKNFESAVSNFDTRLNGFKSLGLDVTEIGKKGHDYLLSKLNKQNPALAKLLETYQAKYEND